MSAVSREPGSPCRPPALFACSRIERRATTAHVASGDSWETEALICTVGNARMPVNIAVTRGERYANDSTTLDSPEHRPVATHVTLGGNDSLVVRIGSPFELEKVVEDPDSRVLQLRRKLAERKAREVAAGSVTPSWEDGRVHAGRKWLP